jgi:hypothetical protein
MIAPRKRLRGKNAVAERVQVGCAEPAGDAGQNQRARVDKVRYFFSFFSFFFSFLSLIVTLGLFFLLSFCCPLAM